MKTLVASLADNKSALGRRYAEWAVSAPTLESAVAAAAMAQDELGHARSTYPVLKGLGVEANEEMTNRHAEATLATATALNPHIGYDRAADIVKAAAESGRSLREVALEQGVEPSVLEEALDHRRMARPHE